MKYYLYEIKNNINGKKYVGVHKTKVEDDGYMGSGKVIKRAIEKHGIENFTKTILEYFDTQEAMFAREKEVVTDEFLERDDVYNLRRGGFGGFDHINKNSMQGFKNVETAKLGRINANASMFVKYGSDWKKVISSFANSTESIQKGLLTKKNNGYKPDSSHMNTDKANTKRKDTFKKNGHQSGSKNSMFGKMWITDGTYNKTITKDSEIPAGWSKGRKLK
jgi:hypothetical protein